MNETREKEQREGERERQRKEVSSRENGFPEVGSGGSSCARGYFRAALFLLALPATRARRSLLINLFRAKAGGGKMAISRVKDSEKRHRRPGYKNKKDWPTAKDLLPSTSSSSSSYIFFREKSSRRPHAKFCAPPPNLPVKRLNARSSKLWQTDLPCSKLSLFALIEEPKSSWFHSRGNQAWIEIRRIHESASYRWCDMVIRIDEICVVFEPTRSLCLKNRWVEIDEKLMFSIIIYRKKCNCVITV